MSADSKPHSEWEKALSDLKNYASYGHAGEVPYLRSIEIAGGLVRDHVRNLQEQFETARNLVREARPYLVEKNTHAGPVDLWLDHADRLLGISNPASMPDSAQADGAVLATDLPNALPGEADLTGDLIDGDADE